MRIAEPLCAGPVTAKDTSPFAGFHVFWRCGIRDAPGKGMPSLRRCVGACTRLASSGDGMEICDSVLLMFPLD